MNRSCPLFGALKILSFCLGHSSYSFCPGRFVLFLQVSACMSFIQEVSLVLPGWTRWSSSVPFSILCCFYLYTLITPYCNSLFIYVPPPQLECKLFEDRDCLSLTIMSLARSRFWNAWMQRCCASSITHSVARGTHSNTVAVILCVILQTGVLCHSIEDSN